MLDVRRWLVLTVLVPVTVLMIGCANDTVNLRPKVVNLINKDLGIEPDLNSNQESAKGKVFLGFVAWDSEARQGVKFNRIETENGKPIFTSQRIKTKTIRVEKVEKISTYSVVGCKLMDEDSTENNQTVCNLFKIDGENTILACKKDDKTKSSDVQKIAYEENKNDADIVDLSPELVAALKDLAKESGIVIKNIDFASVVILEQVKEENRGREFISTLKLLVSEDYELNLASPNLLGSITEIEVNPISPSVVSFKKNPCCIIEERNGAAVETCYKKCF